ncbi:duboraya [Corythoichthys intestinalis]|uniref:duboraya n=1 Tax=Corythoichthys intestinalis TaxID=161448 RepID=UPI0025A50356|nr:duboraya [Corythoichthys intestinalis]XP_057677057.1 duboraya [Corythoichthys intestinalis]
MQEEREQEAEERISSRPSVAELAGRFKGSSPPSASETEKPVRRRPPRTLQLPKCHGDEHEKAEGVTSPVKVKRNSALIEKLQANLALSPTALLPSPRSPGIRPLLPFSSPSSPSPVAGSPSSTLSSPAMAEEEGPVSFDAPATATEGSLLVNVNKTRARHSLKRRPPSRRHRKSSSGEEACVAKEETDTVTRLEHKTRQEAGEGDVFSDENQNHLKNDKSDKRPNEDQTNNGVGHRGEGEDDKRVDGEESQDGVSVEEEKQEKTSAEDQNNNQEKSQGSTCQS